MILIHSGDFLSDCYCFDMEEMVKILTVSPAVGTHQKKDRLLKNIDGSTGSYFPHSLPSPTMISDQNF